MQSPIAGKILRIISNGSWHSLKDVAGKLKSSIEDVKDEVNTLSRARMGDSKTEFVDKTKDLPFKWLEEKPDVLMGKIQAEIDGLNSLADVKAFLKKLALTYGKPLWCIVQEEFEK